MKSQETQTFSALYYERVSTQNEEQTNSLENQRKLCMDYLERHPEIVLAEPIESYSERISGKSDQREKYTEMMARITRGDIAYILVKDLKRLSRSTEVSAQFRNHCKRFGVKLILLSTGQIYDPNSESNRMLYGFESLLNEEVVYRQSEYARIAHKQKMAEKRLNANNCIFGYRWNNGDMEIYEEEAQVIREIFDLLVFKDYGNKEIRKYLAQKGLYVSPRSVRLWLQETAYIGIFQMNKKGSVLGVGTGQKTRYFRRPREEWVAVNRPDLAIVNPDIFNLAQKIMMSRKRTYDADKNGICQARFKGFHLFSGKIFCEECGKSYQHFWCDRKMTISAYKDSFKQKCHNALDECANTDYARIYEDEIERIVLLSINTFINEHKQCFDSLLSILKDAIKAEYQNNDYQNMQMKKIAEAKKEAKKILQMYMEASGAIREALSEEYDRINTKLLTLERDLEIMKKNISSENELEQKIRKIENTLEDLKEIKVLNRKIVTIFVKRITINKEGKIKVILNTDTQYIEEIKKWNEQKRDRQILAKESVFSFGLRVDQFYYEIMPSVMKKGIEGTMALCPLHMQILLRIC